MLLYKNTVVYMFRLELANAKICLSTPVPSVLLAVT